MYLFVIFKHKKNIKIKLIYILITILIEMLQKIVAFEFELKLEAVNVKKKS